MNLLIHFQLIKVKLICLGSITKYVSKNVPAALLFHSYISVLENKASCKLAVICIPYLGKIFTVADGYAPFLSLSARQSIFSKDSESLLGPGHYDCSPVKVSDPFNLQKLNDDVACPWFKTNILRNIFFDTSLILSLLGFLLNPCLFS